MSPAAPILDRSRVEIRLGTYGIAPATALSDITLIPRAQEYRRITSGRTTAIGKEDIRVKLPVADYHVSRKEDGEFAMLVVDGKESFLVNPGGTVRVGAAFLEEAHALVSRAGAKRVLAAGEIFVATTEKTRSRVHDVARATRQPEAQSDVDSLRFSVFDLLEVDGKAVGGPFADTWKRIEKLFGGGERVKPVEAVFTKKIDEIEERFAHWVERQGAEGIVARSDVAGLYKVKPRHTIDACVIGFTEGVDDRKGLLHDMLVALMREDGTFHTFTRVGGGFTEEDRRTFLSDLKDMACESEYAEVNQDHVAYQMVRPEWVIEISCLDFVSQTTRGATIDRMVLNWDPKASKYNVVRRLPLVSAIGPQFVRRREDKSVKPNDLRIRQVSDIVEVPMADRDARRLTMPRSEVLKREAWTKVLKGGTMVRKLVLWKTNKEKEGGDFPAYVLHFTDFSPNRKTMLEREIRVSNSREQMDELWMQLVEANILKGWAKAPL